MISNIYNINIDDVDIKDYTNIEPYSIPNGQAKIIDELSYFDVGIKSINLSKPNFKGGFSKVYIYTSSINGNQYVLRDELKSRLDFGKNIEELHQKTIADANIELHIQNDLSKDDIAPKIYYGAMYKNRNYNTNENEYRFITIMDKYNNLSELLEGKPLKNNGLIHNKLYTIEDKINNYNNIIEIFQQCLTLVYKMIYIKSYFCADQKIDNFVYKQDNKTGKYDIKMIDFDNKFCNSEKIINKIIFKEGLSPEEIEKNKYYYMKLLWLQIILFFDRTSGNYLSKNDLIEKIITTTIALNFDIVEKYNEDTYKKFMCDEDFINWVIKNNTPNLMYVYRHYIGKSGDEINHRKILKCLTNTLSKTAGNRQNKNQNRKTNKNQNRKSNKNQNRSSNKKHNRSSNKKHNRTSNKNQNRKTNKNQNRKSKKKQNRKSNKNQNRK